MTDRSTLFQGSNIDDVESKGIIPRITDQIFDSIMSSPPNLEYLVKVSYMEIYMEKIRDLLAPQNDNLQIHEEKNKGVYVKGLSDYYVGGQEDVHEIMRQGGNARAVSSTNMNAESSRSHSIFLLTIQQKNTDTGTQKTGNLYLVDLAGSEKVGKTGASGQTLEEAKKINKSLSALGMVINALTDGKSSHIPYRDSKLTRILQESLGGNSRTTLIVNASPCAYNVDETISTLRFGVRAKSIKNKARVNAELSPAELKALLKKSQTDSARYQNYIAALEAELKVWRSGGKVAESDRADMSKVSGTAAPAAAPSTPRPASNLGGIRPQTPGSSSILANDSLRDLSSRPETPTAVSMDKDEREEFLRRENELSDQIAEKEAALNTTQASLNDARDELVFLRERETALSNDNSTMTDDLSRIKRQLESVVAEHSEMSINLDQMKETNEEISAELEELRRTLGSSGAAGLPAAKGVGIDADATLDPEAEQKRLDKEARVQKLVAETAGSHSSQDPAARLRATLDELPEALKEPALDHVDRLTADEQKLRAQAKALRQDNDQLLILQENLEIRLKNLQTAYEDMTAKATQGAGADLDEIKKGVSLQLQEQCETLETEVTELRQKCATATQLLDKANEDRNTLQVEKAELQRTWELTTSAIQGGQDLAESAREMERVRKSMAQQLSDFDTMKRSLMRDLQNRCEKVVELEISLDESREQYNNVVRASNTKSQQRKMAFLERNLEQLTHVQKQLVEQNSSLKKEVVIAERKLNARNDRIQSLESLLAESQERINQQNAKYEAQMALVRERFESARNLSRTISGGSGLGAGPGGGGSVQGAGGAQGGPGGLNFGRIAKPLRGGGSNNGPQPGPQAVAATGPAPRLQHPGVANVVQQQAAQFDSKSPKARSSWFFSSS